MKKLNKIAGKKAQNKANKRAAKINNVIEEDFNLSRTKLDISELMTEDVLRLAAVGKRKVIGGHKRNRSNGSPSKKVGGVSPDSPPGFRR